MRKLPFSLQKMYKFFAKRKRFIAFLALVIIFIDIIMYGLNYTSPPTNKGTINENTSLVPANTVYSIEPLHYTYIHFFLANGSWNLVGSMTSSTYIFIYIVNQSGFSNLTQGRAFKWRYEAFADSGCEVNVTLTSGSYYLVFYNQNTAWGVGVEITSNFILTKK